MIGRLLRAPGLATAGVMLMLLRLFELLLSPVGLGPMLQTISTAPARRQPQRVASLVAFVGVSGAIAAHVLIVLYYVPGPLASHSALGAELGLMVGIVSIQCLIRNLYAERTGEVQTLIALGALPLKILALLLIEALVLAIPSSLIAVAIGALLAHLWLPASVHISVPLLICTGMAMVVVVLLANFCPAWKVTHLSLAHCLAGQTRAPRQLHPRPWGAQEMIGAAALASAWFVMTAAGGASTALAALLCTQWGSALLLPRFGPQRLPKSSARTAARSLKRVVRADDGRD